MKPFALALSSAFSIAVLFFAAVFALVIPSFELAESMQAAAVAASLPALALPAIAEALERATARRHLAAGKPTAIYNYHEFQLPWPVMVLCGSLVLFAIDWISTFIASLAAGISSASIGFMAEDFSEHLFLAALAINVPTLMVGGYFVSRWIGTRCSRGGTIAVLLTCILATAAATGLTALMPVEGAERAFILLNLLELPFVLFCGLVGYWRGRRARWSKYLGYLLGVLPPETRDTIVDLAFTETRKAVAAATPPAGGSQSV
jgi:hypothetical protein